MVGFGASVIGAISGLGGGVIIKPVLDALTTLDAQSIAFASSVSVLAMSVASVIRQVVAKTKFDVSVTVVLGIGAVLGGFAGAALFDRCVSLLSDGWMKLIQNALLFVLLIAILLYMNQSPRPALHLKNRLVMLAVGVLLGTLAAFLGIGGGPINVAALCLFFSMDLKNATVNSLVLIIFSQAAKLATSFGAGTLPMNFQPMLLVIMATGAVLGGVIGAVLNRKISPGALKTAYNAVMLLVVATCVYNIVKIAV